MRDKRAVKEAGGKLLGFLDDDNYPELSWVAAAYAFGQKYPKAGAYGSQIHPDMGSRTTRKFSAHRSIFGNYRAR